MTELALLVMGAIGWWLLRRSPPVPPQIIHRVSGRRWPPAPPTADERLAIWRMKYDRVPVDMQVAPIHRKERQHEQRD